MEKRVQQFLARLSPAQRELVDSLTSPQAIQAYLDSLPYVGEELNRNPLRVMADRQCHCLDGGLLAAAVMRCIGYPPVIIDLLPEPGTDDDHVLVLFKENGHWGALAKSNYAGLRYREPVYRTLRELVMSYFEVFFNVAGQKTLREYTRPVYLKAFDQAVWMWEDAAANQIEHALKEVRRFTVLTPQMAAQLTPIDRRSYEAGMFGANPEGLFKQTGA